MKRIWLNHWFSTAYFIINMMRENNPEFQFIASNENQDSPIMKACDEWYQEPVLKGKEYVDFCLDFCEKHSIDVFMPRRGMVEISKYKKQFEQAGTKVMVDDYPHVSLLNDKAAAYDYFRKEGIGVVPDYYLVTNAAQFEDAYHTLAEKYGWVCFKFVHDEGGKSYRLIDNSRRGYAALFKKITTRLTYEEAIDALSERETFSPLMVMPYLPGNEISVDCLKTSHGIIAIPRLKDYSRIERIHYDDGLLETCEKLLDKIPLECPCNIQFKYLNDTPFMLEVNTRMSGGTHLSCAATGVNIPDIAVNKLLGIDKPWQLDRKEARVTHVELPVVL